MIKPNNLNYFGFQQKVYNKNNNLLRKIGTNIITPNNNIQYNRPKNNPEQKTYSRYQNLSKNNTSNLNNNINEINNKLQNENNDNKLMEDNKNSNIENEKNSVIINNKLETSLEGHNNRVRAIRYFINEGFAKLLTGIINKETLEGI